MVIQFDNQHYIKETDRFSGFLVLLSNIKIFLRDFFGLVGLVVFMVALSPLVMILIWRLTSITSKILKESKEEKEKLKLFIIEKGSKYEDLIEIEDSLKRITEKTEKVAYLKSSSSPKVIVKLLDNLYFLHKELLEMKDIIRGSYLYNQKELGLSDAELIEYNNQFRDLKDIWDYESSPGEKVIAFNHKRKLQA